MNTLVNRYIAPPFSILDTRQNYWLKRRHYWLKKNIFSENGRGRKENELSDKDKKALGRYFTKNNSLIKRNNGISATSVFDPVLTEIIYKWFNVTNGSILDPFAGGSVRGIIAAILGYKYLGVDLSSEQVKCNYDQANGHCVEWIVGDSRNIKSLVKKNDYDLIFTCPPYYNLEIYSNDLNDLSNSMSYGDFLNSYELILKQCVNKLKANRFCVLVIGDIRDHKGNYYGFVADNINILKKMGLNLYNEIILINSLGSLPVRCQIPFCKSRKIAKTHQNVLIFYKGNDFNEIRKDFHDFSNIKHLEKNQLDLFE